jgi:hypothetical protein
MALLLSAIGRGGHASALDRIAVPAKKSQEDSTRSANKKRVKYARERPDTRKFTASEALRRIAVSV